MSKIRFVPLAALALLSAGCVRNERLVGREGLTVVRQAPATPGAETGDLPPPARGDLILEQREYVIGPLDRLNVNVYGVAELTQSVQTDPGGRISLPLIGSLEAAGRTPNELATLIAGRLRGRYVNNPQVTVNLTETVSQTFTVDGQVSSPGAFPAIGRITLMRAIARAGGTGEFANQSYVVVFRQVDNQQMAGLYDLRAIRQGVYEDPSIYPNDVILVGEAYGRRFFRDALQGSGILAAPLLTILR